MRNFFRNLERTGVRYLLISGQASVLYGASTFSEDIDLWVQPTTSNIVTLVSALRKSHAVVHKLTPPIEARFFHKGHGFHFLIPAEPSPVYLDVMGKPPRVRGFGAAFRDATWWQTDWGRLPVVSVPDLVQMKKTRRLADYDTISNLVRIQLLSTPRQIKGPLLIWAMKNCFRIEDAQWIFSTWPRATSLVDETERTWVKRLARIMGGLPAEKLAVMQKMLLDEIGRLQHADIQYWSPIIQELRELRRKGRLLPQGRTV